MHLSNARILDVIPLKARIDSPFVQDRIKLVQKQKRVARVAASVVEVVEIDFPPLYTKDNLPVCVGLLFMTPDPH